MLLAAVSVASLAGIVGVWLQRRRKRAHADYSHLLDGLSWQDFEHIVAEAFRLKGYTVSRSDVGDDRVDLLLRKNGNLFLVNCAQWKVPMVGEKVLRELYGLMAAYGALGGFVVTSGTFMPAAYKFSEGRNLRLLAGPHLQELMRSVPRTVRVNT